MEQGQGASMALPIWAKFFQKAYADKSLKLSKGDFEKPAHLGDIELDCSKYDQKTDSEDPEDLKDMF